MTLCAWITYLKFESLYSCFLLVGGILEHQSIPGISTSNPIGQQRWRVLKGVAVKAKPVTVEAVVDKLNNLLTVLREACVEPVVIGQYFRQVS